MDITERNYNKSDAATRDGYRGASINIHKSTPVSDSLAYVIYSNSYKNDHDTLKLLRVQGTWKVDLKYLFDHDLDTASRFPVKDTLR
jgi:type IV secretory pathway component VirB8